MRHQRVLLAGVVVAIAIFSAVLELSSPHTIQTVSNLGLTMAPALAAAACFYRARRREGSRRMAVAWWLLGAGCASWAFGQATWTWLETVQGRDVPFPSLADVFYLGAVPLVIAGLLWLPTTPRRLAGAARTLLDGVIIAGSVLLVSWIVVIDRVASSDDDRVDRLISLSYPAADVVIITIVLFALTRARRGGEVDVGTLAMLSVGWAGFAVADSGFAYLTATEDYVSGSLIDIGWFACFLLTALAALRPSSPPLPASALEETVDRPVHILLPYAPLVVSALVLAFSETFADHDGPAVVTGVALLVLVVVRQALLALENQSLTGDLEARVASRTDELLRSEETLRLLIEGVADHAIFLVDRHGAIANWNAGAQRLFGFLPTQVLGRSVGWLSAEERPTSEILATAQADGVVEIDGPYRRADGSLFEASGVMTPTYGPAPVRVLHGLVVVVRDVTEQRAAVAAAEALATQLRQKQRLEAVGQLAGGVAHDFNNLLTVISGTTSLIPEAVAAGQPIDADLATIREASARAAALTRQLLTFSRQGSVNTEVLDVGEVVAGVEDLLRRSLGGHLSLVVVPRDRPFTVVADRSQLEQVLVNLAVNARDAMPRGGTVRVDVTEGEMPDEMALETDDAMSSCIRLTVSDDGEGMSPEVQSRAFEPFFTTKPTGHGSGLGLATVYGIVTALGGTVRIDSTLGVGTAVHCFLPASDERPAAPPPTSTIDVTEGRQRTVLVVEDEVAVRQLTDRMLARAGFRVLSAGDGAAAMAIVDHESQIDLVVTDVVMPVMNGRELRELLRLVRPTLPVLFMSGHTAGLLGDGPSSDGDPSLLEKPFTAQSLLAAVASALDTGRAELT